MKPKNIEKKIHNEQKLAFVCFILWMFSLTKYSNPVLGKHYTHHSENQTHEAPKKVNK